MPIWLGTNTIVSTNASRAMGKLIKNTDPHEKCSRRSPPTIGPSPAPPEAIEPQTPIAKPNSRGSLKVTLMIDNVAGIIIDAPTARSTLAATKI
ncbi:hypothetical protein D3C75_762560 [compost metagenome]